MPLLSSYTYDIGSGEKVLEDIADFSNGNCKTEVIIRNDTDGSETFLSSFISTSVEEVGRTYANIGDSSLLWTITNIGSMEIKVETADETLAGSYTLFARFK